MNFDININIVEYKNKKKILKDGQKQASYIKQKIIEIMPDLINLVSFTMMGVGV